MRVGGEFECDSSTPASAITSVHHRCFVLRLVAECGSDPAKRRFFCAAADLASEDSYSVFFFLTCVDISVWRLRAGMRSGEAKLQGQL